MQRASNWSVTINNPISADHENIALARQRGWKVLGQLEKGESGTLHYQLMVKTPQVRFSAVKKQFPRAHIEVALNPKKLEAYVTKSDTKVKELEDDDSYVSLYKLYELFSNYVEEQYPKGAYLQSITSGDEWLTIFDQFAFEAICSGYNVEMLVVNPQIRSVIKKFKHAVIIRANASMAKRQTDRQAELLSQPQLINTNGTNASCSDETQTQDSLSDSEASESSVHSS